MKIKHLTYLNNAVPELEDIIKEKLLSGYKEGSHTIVARYGVNKTTLRKLLRKESQA